MTEHISRKELKQDKVRETFEHGAEAVLSHTRLASIALLALILAASAYLGWKFYSERQTAQAQVALDEAMKIFNAPIAVPGQPDTAGRSHLPGPGEARPGCATKACCGGHTIPAHESRKIGALLLRTVPDGSGSAESGFGRIEETGCRLG